MPKQCTRKPDRGVPAQFFFKRLIRSQKRASQSGQLDRPCNAEWKLRDQGPSDPPSVSRLHEQQQGAGGSVG